MDAQVQFNRRAAFTVEVEAACLISLWGGDDLITIDLPVSVAKRLAETTLKKIKEAQESC